MKKYLFILLLFVCLVGFYTPVFASSEMYDAFEDTEENRQESQNETQNPTLDGKPVVDFAGNVSLQTSRDPIKSLKSGVNNFLKMYRSLVLGVQGAVDLILIGIFILRLTMVANTSGDPRARKAAINGVWFSMIALSLAGASTLFFTLFYNIFKI